MTLEIKIQGNKCIKSLFYIIKRELHSYVYHNICSKIGGVKNTVGTIRANVKPAFFKPVFRCVMLNRST